MKSPVPIIGILALQGDFAEHARILAGLGAEIVFVKHAHQLQDIDGLVIPGGESTTIAKLTGDKKTSIFDAIRQKIISGLPVYGTCMGSIFLAKEIEGSTQGKLALMDISVRRNAFGAQRESHEQNLLIPMLGVEPFPAIFIRGPIVLSAGDKVQILARVPEGIVMAQQDNMLVTAFHPELTDDTRVHAHFLKMVEAAQSNLSESNPCHKYQQAIVR